MVRCDTNKDKPKTQVKTSTQRRRLPHFLHSSVIRQMCRLPVRASQEHMEAQVMYVNNKYGRRNRTHFKRRSSSQKSRDAERVLASRK